MTGRKALPATAWQCDIDLDYNTTYYWRVRAIGSDTYSLWSDTGIFTTEAEPTITPPEPPSLQVPSPGAGNVCLNPSFAWSGVDWATGYEFILDEDSNFTHPVISKLGKNALPTAAWQCDTELDYNTTYYWKVRAIESDTCSPWSNTGIFTTEAEAVEVFTCPKCGLTFDTQAELLAHWEAMHAPPPPTPYWIWVIITIVALLVIAVLIMIIRTRRVA